MNTPRVAIVHDWMLLGGAEKVVEQLLELYPDAPLYTSCLSSAWAKKLQHRTVVTGYLNNPILRKVRKFTPYLRQRWFENLDLSNYDIIISSSGAEAKGIKVAATTLHINYCHAPTHYYWSRYEQYMKNPGFGILNPVAKLGLKLLLKPMRKWDLQAAKRPDVMIANSTHIAEEIKKYYHREAVVIHPPVDTKRFVKTKKTKRTGYVIAGRQTPYKRFDLAIATANIMQLPLEVLGDGPEHARLVAAGGPTVTFKTNVSDQDIVLAFQSAKGFLFTGLDDFGITPVEAMAAGCPVIAYKAGGALDYVEDGVTGVFFDKQSPQSVVTAIRRFEATEFKESIVVKKAVSFNPEAFKVRIRDLVEKEFAKFHK